MLCHYIDLITCFSSKPKEVRLIQPLIVVHVNACLRPLPEASTLHVEFRNCKSGRLLFEVLGFGGVTNYYGQTLEGSTKQDWETLLLFSVFLLLKIVMVNAVANSLGEAPEFQ